MSLTAETIRHHADRKRSELAEQSRKDDAYSAWVRPLLLAYARQQTAIKIGEAQARGDEITYVHVDTRRVTMWKPSSYSMVDHEVQNSVCLEVAAECAALGFKASCDMGCYGDSTMLSVKGIGQ
jgi:hypothetical protein